MKKEECINYLNKIKPYINLSEICKSYNLKNPENPIDYNNLRVSINRTSSTRLSEERLNLFISYLFNTLYTETFETSRLRANLDEKRLKGIISKNIDTLVQEVVEEVKNGI